MSDSHRHEQGSASGVSQMFAAFLYMIEQYLDSLEKPVQTIEVNSVIEEFGKYLTNQERCELRARRVDHKGPDSLGVGPQFQLAASDDFEKAEAGFSCHLREMELCCVGAMSILHNPNGLPVTELELKRQCQYLDETAQCFDRYVDSCLTTNQRQVVDMFAGDLFTMEQEFCSNGTELRNSYMKHAACYRAIQKDRQKTCVADLQVGLEPIHKLESGARLASACCNINRLKECVLPAISEKCGQDALDLVRSVMDRAFGNVLNVLCREYDPESDNCKKILPKIGSKPYNGRNTSAISRLISGYSAPM